MKIIDIINGEKPSLSFEVFPPKTSDNFETVKKANSLSVDLLVMGELGVTSYTCGDLFFQDSLLK